MAESKLSINVKVTDVEEIKSLLLLLAENIESLPDNVVEALKLVADGVEFFDINYLSRRGICGGDVVALIDGVEVENVISGNPILKTVSITGSSDVSAESFQISNKNGDFICGWGEKFNVGGDK